MSSVTSRTSVQFNIGHATTAGIVLLEAIVQRVLRRTVEHKCSIHLHASCWKTSVVVSQSKSKYQTSVNALILFFPHKQYLYDRKNKKTAWSSKYMICNNIQYIYIYIIVYNYIYIYVYCVWYNYIGSIWIISVSYFLFHVSRLVYSKLNWKLESIKSLTMIPYELQVTYLWLYGWVSGQTFGHQWLKRQ